MRIGHGFQNRVRLATQTPNGPKRTPEPTRHGKPDRTRTMMTDQPMTIVTVVFEAEREMLILQARSLARHWPSTSVARILVIDNSERGPSGRWTRRLLQAYGPHRDRVEIVAATAFLTDAEAPGWIRQQIAKLAISEQIETPAYLVLDAKNHLVRDASSDDLSGPDGRWHLRRINYSSHPLRAHVSRVLDFLDLGTSLIAEPLPGTTTPFVFVTAEVRELWAALAEHGTGSAARTFTDAGLIEFVLYGTRLMQQGKLEDLHDSEEIGCTTLWPRHRSTAQVSEVLKDGTRQPFLAVHRSALARMSVGGSRRLVDFWITQGLFTSRWSTWSFLLRARGQVILHALQNRLKSGFRH